MRIAGLACKGKGQQGTPKTKRPTSRNGVIDKNINNHFACNQGLNPPKWGYLDLATIPEKSGIIQLLINLSTVEYSPREQG